MKRRFDLLLALIAAALLLALALLVAVAVKLTSAGPILCRSQRKGRNNVVFDMPKFRTMKTGAPVVATHLLANPASALIPIGSFLQVER